MTTFTQATTGARHAPVRIVDMHCHLELMQNPTRIASEADALGLGVFCTTVTPADYDRLELDLAAHTNVRLGIGAHPWWVADGSLTENNINQAALIATRSQFVGEIGLDFSKRCPQASFDAQRQAFEQMCRAAAQESQASSPTVLSIHAVRATTAVLEILERTGALSSCACIFHWFSGSVPELEAARDAGCYFSFGERSLQTGKGREYVKLVPQDRLLLETDYPPAPDWAGSAQDILNSLLRVAKAIAQARGATTDQVIASTCQNSCKLLVL